MPSNYHEIETKIISIYDQVSTKTVPSTRSNEYNQNIKSIKGNKKQKKKTSKSKINPKHLKVVVV